MEMKISNMAIEFVSNETQSIKKELILKTSNLRVRQVIVYFIVWMCNYSGKYSRETPFLKFEEGLIRLFITFQIQ